MTHRLCTVTCCTTHVHARGWCRLHYERWERTGNPEGSARPSVRAADRAEDVEFLLDQDPATTLTQLAARFGIQRDSLMLALRRAGRHDLADRLIGRTTPTQPTAQSERRSRASARARGRAAAQSTAAAPVAAQQAGEAA